MVAAGRDRLFYVPRGADQQFGTDRVPLPRYHSLAANAAVAEPERWDDVGADPAAGRHWLPATAILHPWPESASPSNTQGGSRVPESGSHGSVRGARGNSRPYRELRRTAR